MTTPNTSISDTVYLLETTFIELEESFRHNIHNPLCLFGASAVEEILEDLLTTHPHEIFSSEEIDLFVSVHGLCGEILEQYELFNRDH